GQGQGVPARGFPRFQLAQQPSRFTARRDSPNEGPVPLEAIRGGEEGRGDGSLPGDVRRDGRRDGNLQVHQRPSRGRNPLPESGGLTERSLPVADRHGPDATARRDRGNRRATSTKNRGQQVAKGRKASSREVLR